MQIMYGLYLHRIKQISEEHSPYVCAGQNTFYISITNACYVWIPISGPPLCADIPSQESATLSAH